jgi:hypothetical protein
MLYMTFSLTDPFTGEECDNLMDRPLYGSQSKLNATAASSEARGLNCVPCDCIVQLLGLLLEGTPPVPRNEKTEQGKQNHRPPNEDKQYGEYQVSDLGVRIVFKAEPGDFYHGGQNHKTEACPLQDAGKRQLAQHYLFTDICPVGVHAV